MGRYLDIIEAESQRQDSGGSSESTNRQHDKSDQSDKSHLEPVSEHETVCNFTTKGSRAEAPRVGTAATLTNDRAAELIPRTPEGPIPWHDAIPDERAEIKAALFEGLPVTDSFTGAGRNRLVGER